MIIMQSPSGRLIEEVTGEPEDIRARGLEMVRLGSRMENCASVLADISTRATADQGQAVDALRESIGDSYVTLREAAELYKPLGPIIRQYGTDLAAVMPVLNGHVGECERLLLTYISLPGEVQPRGTGGLFQPEDGSPEAEQQRAEDEAKKAAWDAYQAEGELFDRAYDTWEEAFDTAVSGLSEEMAGTIEDGGWRSFLHGFSEVLGWAGLIVGVAALIIGGPLLAAIALAIGVVALAVTVIQAVQFGDKNGWDIAFAVAAIIPVGKLGPKFMRLDFADEVSNTFKVFKPSTWSGAWTNRATTDGLISIGRTQGWKSALSKGVTGYSKEDWIGLSFLYTLGDAGQSLKVGPVAMVAEGVFNLGTNVLKYQGWFSKAFGDGSSWKQSIPEPVRILL
ncbi:hypothetical protein [Microbacterium album]|uniref:Uncharacterized protein n=1 Tax=Microbacterium album TaxID=2053191 RepID=A0A917IFA4_9MICO|nr:hypothetical protein [Microbacterium album]GGH42886.1 hypothetical protein GCM10010921_16380 [Microbacterium album]